MSATWVLYGGTVMPADHSLLSDSYSAAGAVAIVKLPECDIVVQHCMWSGAINISGAECTFSKLCRQGDVWLRLSTVM